MTRGLFEKRTKLFHLPIVITTSIIQGGWKTVKELDQIVGDGGMSQLTRQGSVPVFLEMAC